MHDFETKELMRKNDLLCEKIYKLTVENERNQTVIANLTLTIQRLSQVIGDNDPRSFDDHNQSRKY